MAIWQSDVWQGSSGKWYCNNTKNLGAGSGEWYLPARILDMTPAAFIEYLIKEFKPDYCYYDEDKNFFSYAWADYGNCNRWKLYINKVSRQKNFQI